jgi:hypothetical protein
MDDNESVLEIAAMTQHLGGFWEGYSWSERRRLEELRELLRMRREKRKRK